MGCVGTLAILGIPQFQFLLGIINQGKHNTAKVFTEIQFLIGIINP